MDQAQAILGGMIKGHLRQIIVPGRRDSGYIAFTGCITILSKYARSQFTSRAPVINPEQPAPPPPGISRHSVG